MPAKPKSPPADLKTKGIGCRGKPGPGRPKGLQNKVTRALKDMILGALTDAGGQQYLVQQAKANPVAFLSLVGRLVPQELKADVRAKVNATIDPAQFFADLFRRPENGD